MQSQTKKYDARLRCAKGKLSLLVDAMNHEEAKHLAIQDAITAGHEDVEVEWCIEYPPANRPRAGRAITD